MSVPWHVRGGSLRNSIILVLFHMGKLKSHKVFSDNGVMGSKPKIQSYWGETMILWCHSSLHRASSYGSISLVYSNRERSQKCYFVSYESFNTLIQCWQNYINTPTENLHILNPFWSFFMYALSPLQFSTHAGFFFFGLWCFFFPPIVLLLAAHPPFLNNLDSPSLHVDVHTHTPHSE